MLHNLIVLLFCCLIFSTTQAQDVLKGRVYENHTHVTLAGVGIKNLRTKALATTDTEGNFSISCHTNDLLVFTTFAYQPDTVVVTDFKPKEVYMDPQVNMLKDVKVQGVETHTGNMMAPEFHGQTMVYQRNPDGSLKGGVAFRIHGSNKDEHKRERDAQLAYEDSVKPEVDKVFSKDNLLKYLPIKPEEVASFQSLYTPSVKVYKSKDFNLLAYLNKCYKEFITLPPEKRLSDKLTN